MKVSAEVAEPPGVVTVAGPLVVPGATVALSQVDVPTVKLVTGVPLMLTAVVPAKFVPVIASDVPTGPIVGDTFVTVGAGITVNQPPEPVPPSVVTETAPSVVPIATVAVICVLESTV